MFIPKPSPNIILGILVALSVAIPTWLASTALGATVGLNSWIAAGAMIAYCLHRSGKIWSRINVIDVGVAGLVLTTVATDWLHDGVSAVAPFRSYGEWALPYVAGRFAVMRPRVVIALAPWWVSIAGVVAIGAAYEAVTGANLWEIIFGEVDDLVIRSRSKRYDLFYRAIGPTRHPIFLGIVFVLLLPWVTPLCANENSRRIQACGWLGLALIVIGILATVSRGPLLCLGIVALSIGAFYWRWFRLALAGATAVGIVLAAVGWNQLISFLDKTESIRTHSRVVEVDGKYEEYTGTRNRLFVAEIYGPLVLRGGLLGFGTDATSSFPPNIPGLPASTQSQQILGIVDNSYILIGLRLGWLGLIAFVTMLFAAIWNAFALARDQSLVTYPQGPAFLVVMGSVLIAVSFEILTVFSSYDFFFWLLFSCGVVAGLTALDVKIRRGEMQID